MPNTFFGTTHTLKKTSHRTQAHHTHLTTPQPHWSTAAIELPSRQFWRILMWYERNRVMDMRLLGQLAGGAGVILIGLTLVLAWWRGEGPSTAFLLVLSRNQTQASAWDLVQMNADGSDMRVLLNSQAFEIAPDWSPDGRSIVYARILGLQSAVWRYDFDTGATYALMDESYDVFAPRFSPDGTQIVAQAQPNQIGTLFVMDAATGAFRPLAPDLEDKRNPIWSADGQAIIYASGSTLRRLSLDASTNDLLLTVYTPWRVDIAQDGDWMAFLGDIGGQYGLMRANVDGSLPIIITSLSGSPNSAPAISPDGTWIWYTTSQGLHRVRSSGGEPELMLQEPATQYRDPSWSPLFDRPYHPSTPLLAGIGSAIVGAGLLAYKWRI